MKKKTNIIITVVIAIILIMLPLSGVEAASFTVSSSSVTLDIEKSATITINASTHTGRINITSSDSNIATVNTGSLWVENNSQKITISAKNAGNATITISGELYDSEINTEKEYTETINVTVNKVQEVTPAPEPEPETPTTPGTTPEPETPIKPTVLEFTSVNETVYATGTVNVRKSYSASSDSLGQLKEGDRVTRIGVSKNAVEGYYWSKVTYNGKTAYVISSKLAPTKPTEETPQEETPTQEPKEQEPIEEPAPVDESSDAVLPQDGLKSLEIEGITLTPAFNTDVYEYRAIVKKDLSELPINAIAVSEGATVTIAGNKIDEGENLIAIVVYNSKGEVEATYQISVNKNTLDLSITDAILKNGALTAKRERTIYITIFTVSFVGLIVVMILRSRLSSEDDYEEDYENSEEFTQNEQTVENEEKITLTNEQIEQIMKDELQESVNDENIQEEFEQQEIMVEMAKDEIAQQEIRRPRREKRKGKHF